MAVKIKENKGSILILSVIFSFLTVLLGTAFITYAVLLHGLVSYQIASQQAFYDGSTGALLGALDYMVGRHDRGELREFYKDNYVGYKLLGYGDGRAESPDGSIKIAGYGRSIYSGSNAAKKVIVSLSPNGSFADYLHLIGECRDPLRHNIIYFWTPDTVDGRAHFNDSIFISAPPYDRPVFLERVTTSARVFPLGHHARFLKGIGYRPPIVFNDQATELRAVAGWSTGTLGHDSLTQLALSGDLIYYRKCGRARVDGVEKLPQLADADVDDRAAGRNDIAGCGCFVRRHHPSSGAGARSWRLTSDRRRGIGVRRSRCRPRPSA